MGATTERGLPRPRLSPTTTATPPTVTATWGKGLPRLRLSPTTMATPPTAMPTTVKIVQPIIDLITTSNHRACFNINLVTVGPTHGRTGFGLHHFGRYTNQHIHNAIGI